MAAEIQMILNFLVILIFAYLLSEIKFGQYRMKTLTTTSVWLSNIIISLFAVASPLLGGLWGGMFHGEKDSTPALLVLFVSIPVGLIFFIYFSLRILTSAEEEDSSP